MFVSSVRVLSPATARWCRPEVAERAPIGNPKGTLMSVSVEDALVHELRSAGCVFAEDEARLILAAASDRTNLVSMVQRRVSGVPLEHVLGWAEFCGLRIAVDAEVFVPRRRTEFLVDRAAALMREGAVVVDLCCGSGAVGIALAALIDSPELYAVDIDPAAVRCARRNMPAERVFEGDLYDPLPASLRGQVHVLVANAPYVPTEAIRLMPPRRDCTSRGCHSTVVPTACTFSGEWRPGRSTGLAPAVTS